jgi:branched-chain amino acid transport system permease protein
LGQKPGKSDGTESLPFANLRETVEYYLGVATIAGISVLMALSFYMPFLTGQISLGQAGFMAIGAYAAAVCTLNFHYPYILAVLAGGAVAAAVGFIVGLPALRIKGIYLLLLTLGFVEIVRVVFINLEYTGGAAGLPGIPYQEHSFYYTYAAILVLIVFFLRMRRSRIGKALDAIGVDETAAETLGINITLVKLQAFTVGAFIAGVAGGIFAHYSEYIEPLMFNVMHSVEPIVFTVFGGIQVFWGPIFGALTLTLVPEFLRSIQEWRMELYGVLLILMMIFRPQGTIGLDTLRFLKRLVNGNRGNLSTQPDVGGEAVLEQSRSVTNGNDLDIK